MRELWVIGLLMVVGLAGCLGDNGSGTSEAGPAPTAAPKPPAKGLDTSLLSTNEFGLAPEITAYFPASDGVMLHARVHLPEGEGPWPTIIRNSPYNTHVPTELNEATPLVGITAAAFLVNTYVPKGYAVVVADVRGTGNSAGCFDNMGPIETADNVELVEWVANQTWSDGKIAMHGVSYEGTTPHQALIAAPPSLDTVVTIAGVTNQWRNIFQNGVPYMGRWYHINYAVNEGAMPPTNVDEGPAWALSTVDGTCGQEPLVAEIEPTNYRMGLYNQFWQDRNYTLHVDQAKVPILYSQGFIDRAVNPSEAVHWFNELPVVKKGFFHQGGHIYPPREDYFDTELAWFDHWLKGIENGVMDTPQVEIQLNDGRIRTGEHWPPVARATYSESFYLAPDGLEPEPPADAEVALAAPQAYNGATCTTGEEALVESVLGAPTGLVFESPPLANDTLVSGSPWMHLLGSMDAAHGYWLMDLYAVSPGGDATWLSEGRFNAHLRGGFDTSSPAVPGEATWYHFRFEPREYLLEAGSSLRLEVHGFECGAFLFHEPLIQQTIHMGADGSWLELPILDDPVLWPAPPEVTG